MGTRSTARRSVVIRISSASTGIVSSCSRGNTSRNQPTLPARESTAPRKLTERLVTRPANSKVQPNARTRGQAVGAGTSISRGVPPLSLTSSGISNVAIFLLSASQNVNDGKNDDPNHIDKMPVQGKHFDTRPVFGADASCKREDRHNDEHDHACRDVECVQTDERVIGCPEEIGGDRQPVLVDQPVPFPSGSKEK